MIRLRATTRTAAALLGAALLAGGAGVLTGGPAGAEGSDFTATCQADGTYLVVLNYDTFVAASTVVNGEATLSGAYTGTVPMSPTFLANVGEFTHGSTSIPGTTAGALQMQIQLTSVNGDSGSGVTVELAGDCVAVSADVPAAPAGDPSVAGVSANAAPARAIVAVSRTAG
jgi:hypothetical protein